MVSAPRGSSGSSGRSPAPSRRQRTLGQNFLLDKNILGVIERLAALAADDVVLEVGGGLGSLSAHLAERVAWLHVVELDPRVLDGLRAALDPFGNVQLHVGDALALDLTALHPSPTKLVANLPYGIAATLILRTIEQLPSIASWVVMVQREVGERFAASAGEPAYGAPSVLAQLACEVRVLRAVPRTVFRPIPNVDSVLLGLTRRPLAAPGVAAGLDPAIRKLVNGAFAHRRKPLAKSLALSGFPAEREQIRDALVGLGHPADVRAERLSPAEFRRLADLLPRRPDPPLRA